MAERKEPLGATIAATVTGLFVLFIDKLLPLGRFFGEFPIFIRVLAAASAGLFVWQARRYWDILGGAGGLRGLRGRAVYDVLLAELRSAGTPARVYRDWLTKALDRVDVFFGDPGRNDKSWFARALGLETPGARWTAPAFDRCLLLALLYPIVTIIAVWALSGHAGVAEWALVALVGALAFAVALAFVGAGTFAVSLVGAIAFAFALTLVRAGTFAATVVGADAFAGVGTFAFAVAFAFGFALVFALTVAVAVLAISDWSVRTSRQGAFLSLFFVATTIATFVNVWFSASSEVWPSVGPLFLVLGVLTLVNAPFDWFAIGLTRGLLRRGLAPTGLGPFFYAAVDAIVAPPVVVLVAFVTVFAVQTFNDIAVLRAGSDARFLPLGPLYERLETRPGDPEFWWVWLTLFSTLIPSALNLCIAAASLLRGLPIFNGWIVRKMPASGAIRDSDRLLMASALSGQIVGGVLATGLALYFIGVWLLPFWLPILGGLIRNFSQALAAYNAPARIMMWFSGMH
jgi:hypothetical protein